MGKIEETKQKRSRGEALGKVPDHVGVALKCHWSQ